MCRGLNQHKGKKSDEEEVVGNLYPQPPPNHKSEKGSKSKTDDERLKPQSGDLTTNPIQ